MAAISSTSFLIREYRSEDFLTLWRIDQACFVRGIAYSQFELRAYIRRKKTLTLIAERPKTEEIVGFLVAEAGGDRLAHIITLDVLPDYRKQGVGSLLLDVFEARATQGGSRVVRLETAVDNAVAIAFYKRKGFDVIGTYPRYYSNGVDALVLRKELASSN